MTFDKLKRSHRRLLWLLESRELSVKELKIRYVTLRSYLFFYLALDKLEQKGFVTKRLVEGLPERQGNRLGLYKITIKGLCFLKDL